jgi:hypothetical protein
VRVCARVCVVCIAGDLTQGLMHARQMYS